MIFGIVVGTITVVLSVMAALRAHRKADDSAAARDQSVAAKDEIVWQFHPNHGSSMRDSVDRIEDALTLLTTQVGEIAVDVSSVKATVAAQGQQLRHGADAIAEIRQTQQRHMEQHLDSQRGRRRND